MTSFPPAVITWSKVFGELVQSRTVLKDGQLSITNAQKKDSGLYKCTASNKLGQDSRATQLNVVELPHFTVSPPAKLEKFTIQDITVPCQATGDPQPKVTWMKENGQLPSGRSKVSKDGTLEIWNITEEDSGKYTCTASSNEVISKATSGMDLTVRRGTYYLKITFNLLCTLRRPTAVRDYPINCLFLKLLEANVTALLSIFRFICFVKFVKKVFISIYY